MVAKLLNAQHLTLRDSAIKADNQGWIPLHHAAYMGSSYLTRLLLNFDRRKTAYIKDSLGRTAFQIAAHQGHLDVLKELMNRCPDCSELVDNEGKNALHYAAEKNSELAIHFILGKSSLRDLHNEKDDRGNTPLHYQVNCRGPTTMLLDDDRFDIMAFNNSNRTALDVACSNKPFLSKATKFRQLELLGARHGARREPIMNDEEEEDKEMFSKEAEQAHLIVATLIATVTFAAGFTMPGGIIPDGEHKGSAMLGQMAAFKAFIITNTLALVCSASAAFIHLFSSPKEGKSVIPRLRRTAFSLTLVAIGAMIIAFVTGVYAVLRSSTIGIAVLAIGLLFFSFFHSVLVLHFEVDFVETLLSNICRILWLSISGILLALWLVVRSLILKGSRLLLPRFLLAISVMRRTYVKRGVPMELFGLS